MSEKDSPIRAYRSCFIADVQIGNGRIRLQDTGKNFFFLDQNDKVALESFKIWFQSIFFKGVAQTPSIFQYVQVEDGEGAFDFYIKKFIVKPSNLGSAEAKAGLANAEV